VASPVTHVIHGSGLTRSSVRLSVTTDLGRTGDRSQLTGVPPRSSTRRSERSGNRRASSIHRERRDREAKDRGSPTSETWWTNERTPIPILSTRPDRLLFRLRVVDAAIATTTPNSSTDAPAVTTAPQRSLDTTVTWANR
jgi:hypothetical protein